MMLATKRRAARTRALGALAPVAMLALLLAAPAAASRAQSARGDTLPTALVGTWAGTVALDSASLSTGTPIRITVARDGSVTGRVGDATLADGRLLRSRALFRRVLGLGAPWMLEATLSGPLDARANLRRDRARMPLEFVDGDLLGDFNASGGGRVLSVRARLTRM